MKKYLQEYMKYIMDKLNSASKEEMEEVLQEHLCKIQFMQHERLIHFLVTMLFTLMFFASLGIFAVTEQIGFLVLLAVILCLLIPYIMHYYFLENTVQEMYRVYDKILSKSK